MMKRTTVAVLAIGAALILQGCGAWQSAWRKSGIIEGHANSGWQELEEVKITKGEKPYENETSQKSEPMEVKKEEHTEKREIVYDSQIIPDANLSKYPPLKTTQRRNMAQIREYVTKSSLKPYFVERLHLVRNRAPNGKWVIQRAQNVLYLGHWTQERSTGKKIFTPVEIAECGNEADGFKEVVTPAKIVTTYRNKKIVTVVERYRDTVTVKKITPQPQVEKRLNPLDYNYGGGEGGGGGACGGGGPGGR